MLYHLLYELSDSFSFLNVTRYITFRAGVGLLSALFLSFLLSPWFIRKLKNRQIGQQVRDCGPESHFSKAGTPTMGGGLIIFTCLLPALLWMDLSNRYSWLIILATLGFACIGFSDDYMKVSKKNSAGLSGKKKLLGQFFIAAVVVGANHMFGDQETLLFFPFLKSFQLDLGWFYLAFGTLVIVGASNAVNLTDGLDGLAIGPVMINAACFTILAYVTGNSIISEYLNYPYVPGSGELAIFAACLIGAGLGFLWYNTYPAQVFMGDVGSLPLGGALGVMAFLTKHEILLAIIGGIFVLEALSVITQVASFKLTGKRIFRMAPIHHHFELKGWPEPKVIVRFWIISIILGMVGLLSLKIR